MKCECGHYLATSSAIEITCRCGISHFVEPTVLKQSRRISLGELFSFQILTAGGSNDCGVSDVGALMNRWGIEKSLTEIDRLVAMACRKQTLLNDKTVRDAIAATLIQARMLNG